MKKATIALATLVISLAAQGQQVIKIDSASSQAQVRRDEQGFSSCGVRIVAIKSAGNVNYVYDFSVMFYVKGAGAFAKFGSGKVATTAMLKGNTELEPTLPAPMGFWIARTDQAKAVRPLKYFKADDEAFTLALLDGAAALQAIDDIASGLRMQFNIRYKDDRYDVVNQFTAPLPAEEAASYHACLNGIHERLQAD